MASIAKYFYIIASIAITGYLIVHFKYLFNPILAGLIISLALKPLASKLERYKIHRVISTIVSVVIFIFILLAIIGFFTIGVRAINFSSAEWQLLNNFFLNIQHLIFNTWGFSLDQQSSMFKENFSGVLSNSLSILHNTILFTTSFLTSFVIFILGLFFCLYYRRFFLNFLYQSIQPKYHKKLTNIVQKSALVVNQYIFGLFLVVAIVATLNSIGLILLGIPNAIFFGVSAAILMVIPYIGIMIGSAVPIIIAFLTKDSLWYPFGVLIIFSAIQFLEGNFLTPNIVGSQVKINPFAAILILIIGGMLLGIIGIIFAIPMLAIVKIIFDEIEPLRPLGYLLGNFAHLESKGK